MIGVGYFSKKLRSFVLIKKYFKFVCILNNYLYICNRWSGSQLVKSYKTSLPRNYHCW